MIGGIIDVVLALLPWVVLRKLQLVKREKIGLSVAMSLGAITGVIVIMRNFFQFVQGDYTYGTPPPPPISSCLPLEQRLTSPLPRRLHGLHAPLQLPRARLHHHRPDHPHLPRPHQPRQARHAAVQEFGRAHAPAHVARRAGGDQVGVAQQGGGLGRDEQQERV